MKSSNLALLPSSPSIPSATSALETGAQRCPNLSDPMDCSMPGFPILYHFPKFKQHLGFSGSTFTATLTFSPSGFPWLRESLPLYPARMWPAGFCPWTLALAAFPGALPSNELSHDLLQLLLNSASSPRVTLP